MKRINWTAIILALALVAFFVGFGKNYGNLIKKADRVPLISELKDAPIMGKEEAKAFIEIYSEFQCPACNKYYVETVKRIIDEYIETGKARLAYRDLFFSEGRSQWAIEAVYCANDQGKYWELHDKLLTERYNSQNNEIYEKANLKKTAKELGLNENQFNDCLDSGKYTKFLSDLKQEYLKKGITGVPTTFLNGKMIADEKGRSLGAMPYEALKEKIEALLK